MPRIPTLVMTLLCALFAATPLPAQESPDAPEGDATSYGFVDSRGWQARFEAWVETHLVRPELQSAAGELPVFDPDAVLRILEDLEAQHVHGWRDVPRVPHEVQPRLLTSDISEPLLEAAHVYARGDVRRALDLLRGADLADRPETLHLRAQLLDERTRDLLPIFRLGVIAAYREAIRADASAEQADRAKLRVGQIYLDLGFVPEARAQLESVQDPPLREPFALAARVTLAEAQLLHGDPNAALATLAALDPDTLSPEVRHWRELRRADALFALRRHDEAAQAWATRAAPEPLEPLAAIRQGFALLATDRPGEARDVLGRALERDPPEALRALGGLLTARALRATGKPENALQVASAVPALLSHGDGDPGAHLAGGFAGDTAALAAVEAIEAQRLLGRASLALPPGTSELVAQAPPSPARGLLSYRVAAAPSPGDGPRDGLRRLGALMATLPDTRIQLLAQDDLTRRLSEDLAGAVQAGSVPDAELLDTAERTLRPRHISENALLLAVEGLAAANRRGPCVRWARTLLAREERPLRPGLAAWREVRCLGWERGDRGAALRLMAHADSGRAGPFALALATLAAESQVRLGDVDRAVRTYERAIQAFAEPALLGPVLLRLGELEVSTGRYKLARSRLTRGLSITDAAALASDPFRKAGVLAMGELARRTGQTRQLEQLIADESAHVDPWWQAAYAYLLFRSGVKARPEGDNPFAQGVQEQAQVDAVERRVHRLIGKREQVAAAAAAARAK